ncbi:helix-turn-helix domain-containing protein, partial [Mucilaginibacter sp.]|uniref:helix-turn-helix domain-containing protein n=1 Tax=Mucilaginibacter sp. TaxID=1882438 RepID=UPI0025DC0A4D
KAITQLYRDIELPQANISEPQFTLQQPVNSNINSGGKDFDITHHHEEVEESLSLVEKESDLIRKALKKHKGKRKLAANELGISERTLYRKIKELDL